MQKPKLSDNKIVIITVLLNIVLYNFLKSDNPFNLKNGSFGDYNGTSDEFSLRKSSELQGDFLDKIKLDLPSELLKQKNFVSNISIYTIKTAKDTIFTDEYRYPRTTSYDRTYETLIDYIQNNPELDSKDINIHIAPVKIKLIQLANYSDSSYPSFKATLNDSTTIFLSHKNLLDFTENNQIKETWLKDSTFPKKLRICPRGPNGYITNKTESLARMEALLKHAPFMKKIVDMDRFRSKSEKSNISFCFWLKLSSYEESIKSDMYLTAFAPEYSRSLR